MPTPTRSSARGRRRSRPCRQGGCRARSGPGRPRARTNPSRSAARWCIYSVITDLQGDRVSGTHRSGCPSCWILDVMGVSVVGREAELVGIDAVLAAGRREFAVLVLEGEPGIGKTTVWREGIARATSLGYRVLSCRAASAEARLSFAALGDLLAQVDRAVFEALPDPQRRALDIALLRGEPEGAAPSPRAIGTGVVSLVSGLAAEGPVVLALDDVQWLDRPSARALAFLVRRLEDQPVVVLTTVRAGEGRSDEGLLAIVPDTRVHRVRLGPLSLAALYRIVAEEVGHGLPRPLLVRIERATGGNPFYALEIARSLEVEGTSRPARRSRF